MFFMIFKNSIPPSSQPKVPIKETIPWEPSLSSSIRQRGRDEDSRKNMTCFIKGSERSKDLNEPESPGYIFCCRGCFRNVTNIKRWSLSKMVSVSRCVRRKFNYFLDELCAKSEEVDTFFDSTEEYWSCEDSFDF